MVLSTALLIAAGISAAAGLAGGIINSKAQRDANSANKELQDAANQSNLEIAQSTTAANMEEAERNRQFQKMMSDTSHQREVADLKAAGLNPYASVESLNGAAVTGGATGSASSARMEAARVSPVGDGGALANLASTAQSLAFMMALNQRAEMFNDTRRYGIDSNNGTRIYNVDRWLDFYKSRSRYY